MSSGIHRADRTRRARGPRRGGRRRDGPCDARSGVAGRVRRPSRAARPHPRGYPAAQGDVRARGAADGPRHAGRRGGPRDQQSALGPAHVARRGPSTHVSVATCRVRDRARRRERSADPAGGDRRPGRQRLVGRGATEGRRALRGHDRGSGDDRHHRPRSSHAGEVRPPGRIAGARRGPRASRARGPAQRTRSREAGNSGSGLRGGASAAARPARPGHAGRHEHPHQRARCHRRDRARESQGPHQRPSRRRVRRHRRRGYGPRDPSGGAEAHLRSLLHDEASVAGHGARSLDLARHPAAPGRRAHGRVGARRGGDLSLLSTPSGARRAVAGAAPCAARDRPAGAARDADHPRRRRRRGAWCDRIGDSWAHSIA